MLEPQAKKTLLESLAVKIVSGPRLLWVRTVETIWFTYFKHLVHFNFVAVLPQNWEKKSWLWSALIRCFSLKHIWEDTIYVWYLCIYLYRSRNKVKSEDWSINTLHQRGPSVFDVTLRFYWCAQVAESVFSLNILDQSRQSFQVF